MAYSGKADYRNHTGCVDVPNVGPIPQGRYHIVSRPTGGLERGYQNRPS
ncbi:tlde1 domain-containing protein [Yersinia enterocolitica]